MLYSPLGTAVHSRSFGIKAAIGWWLLLAV